MPDRDLQLAAQRVENAKHFGWAMSSRLIPPKEGSSALTVWMKSSGSLAARQRGNASTTQVLEQQRLAFHHRQSGSRADVAEAEYPGAVGDDGARPVGLVAALKYQGRGRRELHDRAPPRRGCTKC